MMTGQLPAGRQTHAYPHRFFAQPSGMTASVFAAYEQRNRVFFGPGGADTHERSMLRWLTQADPAARPTAELALANEMAAALFTPDPATRALALPASAFGLEPSRTGHVAALPIAAPGAAAAGGVAADGTTGAGAGGALLTASTLGGTVAM